MKKTPCEVSLFVLQVQVGTGIGGGLGTGATMPLDVLASLVTAEANNPKGGGDGVSGAMSMKAWLEQQIALAAAKSKLAVTCV
jgi:hypothetical protein